MENDQRILLANLLCKIDEDLTEISISTSQEQALTSNLELEFIFSVRLLDSIGNFKFWNLLVSFLVVYYLLHVITKS